MLLVSRPSPRSHASFTSFEVPSRGPLAFEDEEGVIGADVRRHGPEPLAPGVERRSAESNCSCCGWPLRASTVCATRCPRSMCAS